MKPSVIKSLMVVLCLLLGASVGRTATVTVGPSGMYATPCAAFAHLVDGDTVQVDANGGAPYFEGNCFITNNNLTITGVNGRPILDGTGTAIDKAIWVVDGHDDVIDNFEFRNANSNTDSGTSSNAEAIRAEEGIGTAAGGNLTVQRCYIHDNGTGILTGSADGSNNWYSSSNFFTFQYDEFAFNGAGDSNTHNMYMGEDNNDNTNFTLQYSWTHDTNIGQLVKTREPNNNIYYNLITDAAGNANYLVDITEGGTTYIVGNVIYRIAACSECNQVMMIYRNVGDPGSAAMYAIPKQDLHFVNNTVINDPSNTFPGHFMSMECFSGSSDDCAAPPFGGSGLTTPGLFENNIFLGPPGYAITNQSEAVESNNIVEENNSTNLAAMGFNNAAQLDFRLVSTSSPAYQAGLYPPTNNVGTADPAELATQEYSIPMGIVSRPTPTGSAMDAGAYHYQTVTAPGGLTVTTSSPVTSPNTGTITVSGLPTPATGQYNYAVFVSTNLSAIAEIPSVASSTTSATATFQAESVASTTVVPVYIYVDGTVLTANVTINPGPPGLESLTLDDQYYPDITLHLSGPGTSPLVVNLSSSDPSILYAPSTVTVPANTLSIETGTLNGGLNPPAGSSNGPVMLTATYGSQSVQLTTNIVSPFTHDFECGSTCNVVGGNPYNVGYTLAGVSPEGGSTIYITSTNTAVIPNQSYFMAAGARNPPGGYIPLTTNTVSSNTSVVLTATYNGAAFYVTPTITVTPPTGPVVASVSGSGQSAPVGTNFPSPLVVSVTNSGSPASGTTVTFSGAGVSFPSGATAVTNSSGVAQVTAQPTASGALNITATVTGGSVPASFSETGTGTPASVTVVSGSGQSGTTGMPFANPLVVVVRDASSNPVPGTTVTFAGTNVSFPSGATAVTNSSGMAQVTAEPTATGALTITASVAGVSTPASFSETGAAAPVLKSITLDGTGPGTTVHLKAVTANPVVVTFSSSNPSLVNAPVTVTIPAGASSAETGTLLGSLWAPAASGQSATLTAILNGVTETLTATFYSPSLHSFTCSPGSCPAVVGGQPYNFIVQLSGTAPIGGGTVQITSSNPAAIPNQTVTIPAGQNLPTTSPVSLTTNAVTATAIVTVTATFNGTTISVGPITVNPVTEIKSVTSDGASSPGTTVNLTAPAPTGGLVVQITSSNQSITSAPATVTVPAGQTSVKIGTSLGSAFTPAGSLQSATISATYNSITQSVTKSYESPIVSTFSCVTTPCPTIAGGNTISFDLALSKSGAPVGGATVTISSDTPAVVPTQTVTIAAGQNGPATSPIQINSNAVTANTVVHVAASYNGSTKNATGGTITITPPLPPASIAVVSGSGQSSNIGTPFTSPLVVLVEDVNSHPVNNATVTFAGTGVSLPSGATATTNSNGQASVTAQPTTSGALTITASVTGVSTPASFSETGNVPVTVTSVTQDDGYTPQMTIHLSGPAPSGGSTVLLSSSNSTVLYAPASVTVPAGATSAEAGTLNGSLWAPALSPDPEGAVTLTATLGSSSAQLTTTLWSPFIYAFGCGGCSVQGGGTVYAGIQPSGVIPVGGATIYITSNNPAVIPNQSYPIAAGATYYPGGYLPIVTNAVSTTTNVTITCTFDGTAYSPTANVTVTP